MLNKAIILLFASCYCISVYAESVFLRLHDQVDTPGEIILLKDIAEVICADEVRRTRLEETPIGLPGQTQLSSNLSRREIERSLAPTIKLLDISIAWGGAKVVKFLELPPTLDFGPAIDAAAVALLASVQQKDEVSIQTHKAPSPFAFSGVINSIEPDMIAMEVNPPYVHVPLAIMAGGARVATREVVFEIRSRESKKQTAESSVAKKNPPVNKAGPVIIKRREGVKIVLNSGAVSIQTEGKALANARLGESVRVKRRTGGVFNAIAVAPGVVEVEVN